MRGAGILGVLWLWSMALMAQTSDDAFQRPLIDVLDELQENYQVAIKYDRRIIGDFVLKYADWRLVPGNLELSLQQVLVPFDYIFVKQGAGIYKVKPYQYHLISPEAGAESLEYLASLYADRDRWEDRKAELRDCIEVALGMKSLPQAVSPRVILSNLRGYDGYRVENIALETVPGLYLTGSIYRPEIVDRKLAVIISPNGHFEDGRYRQDEQLRCASLAKMGAMVVSYDLFGWGESALQVDASAHRESIAHTIQTNNAMRLLDYVLKREDVDSQRVGITGGSGGGSQTMLVAAIDDRIAVSVPVVMTSSFHSGGCPCESGRPIHLCGGRTNNAEIAAMMAPRPQLIVSDGQDWTFQVPVSEYPFIQRTYGFYGAEGEVRNVHFAAEGHDYGFSKRVAMYRFMAEKLGLDVRMLQDESGAIDESAITIEEYSSMFSFGCRGEKLPEDAIGSLEELYDVLRRNDE